MFPLTEKDSSPKNVDGGNCIRILWMSYLMRSVVDSEGQNTSTTSTISMLGLTTRAS